MNFIIDPANGIRYELFSTNGKNLLKQYVKYVQSGGVLLPKDKTKIIYDINEVLNSLRPVKVTMRHSGQQFKATLMNVEDSGYTTYNRIYNPTDILVGLHNKYKVEPLLKYNEKMRYAASLIMYKISKVENEKYKKKHKQLVNTEIEEFKKRFSTLLLAFDQKKATLEDDENLKQIAENENQLISLNKINSNNDTDYKKEFEKACTGTNCPKLVEELYLYETNPIFKNIKSKQFKFSLLGPNSDDSKHLDLLIFVKKTDFILTNERIKQALDELSKNPRYTPKNRQAVTGRVGRGGKDIPGYNTEQSRQDTKKAAEEAAKQGAAEAAAEAAKLGRAEEAAASNLKEESSSSNEINSQQTSVTQTSTI